MRFVCMGYADLSKFESMPEAELNEMMQECFAYDDQLRENGHFVGGEALQNATKARTVRLIEGKVQVIDGPYAETKEQIGGILFLEANDMDHAVELMSKHPGVRTGPFEIRPADAIVNEMIQTRHFQS